MCFVIATVTSVQPTRVPVTTASPLNGLWRLDAGRDIGSLDNFLALEGVDWFKRRAIVGMAMDERLALNATTFSVDRYAPPYGNNYAIHHLDRFEQEEDTLLGRVSVMGHASTDLYKVQLSKTRLADRAVFTGTRHVTRNAPNLLVYAMNFTLSNGQHAECVRHYIRV